MQKLDVMYLARFSLRNIASEEGLNPLCGDERDVNPCEVISSSFRDTLFHKMASACALLIDLECDFPSMVPPGAGIFS